MGYVKLSKSSKLLKVYQTVADELSEDFSCNTVRWFSCFKKILQSKKK